MGETAKRILSGVIIAAYFIFSFNYDGLYRLPLLLLVGAFVFIGLNEFYSMTALSSTHQPYKKTGIAFGLSLVLLVFLYALPKKYPVEFSNENSTIVYYIKAVQLGFHLLAAFFLFLMVFCFLWQLRQNRTEGSIYSIGTTLFGIIYIALSSCHIFLLDIMPWGNFYIWLLAFMTIMSDTMQYAAGRTLGKHKIGLAASPNKSWEGYIGGLIGQVILTQIFYFTAKLFFPVPEFSAFELAFISIIIYLVAVVGDLSESLIKRDSHTKDSGSVIPGHGGILDLIDALMLTIPTSYYIMVLRNYLKTIQL